MNRKNLGIILACAISLFSVNQLIAQSSSRQVIGVIAYNVKGDTRYQQAGTKTVPGGGWNVASVRNQQIKLIIQNLRANDIDFVSLEQASSLSNGKESLPQYPLANYLQQGFQKYRQWQTIRSRCGFDAIQITYKGRKWKPLYTLASYDKTQPNANQKGFMTCLANGQSTDSRPYNMVLFQNRIQPTQCVLFIAAHTPHGIPGQTASWTNTKFLNDFQMMKSRQPATCKLTTIIAGDLNEVGDTDNSTGTHIASLFANNNSAHVNIGAEMDKPHSHNQYPIYQYKNNIGKVLGPKSCCKDSSYQYGTDRIAASGGQVYGVNPLHNSHGKDNRLTRHLLRYYYNFNIREEHVPIKGYVLSQ